MSFDFRPLDDYLLLVPEYRKRRKLDHVESFVRNKFGDDLCFALLEDVNIIDLYDIGMVRIYSNLDEAQSERKVEKYYEIIDKVQAEFQINLAEYGEWYTETAHILTKTNEASSTPTGSYRWREFEKREKTKLGKRDYGYRKRSLDDHWINSYLSFYAQLMHEDFGLSVYPNYAIIVRPISAIDQNRHDSPIIHLGNLYLHFATRTPRNDAFYQGLLNDFLRIWYEVNTPIMLGEQSEVERALTKDYYPSFSSNKKRMLTDPIKKSKVRVLDFYDHVFEKKQEHFEERRQDFGRAAIDFFTNIKVRFNRRFFDQIKTSGKTSLGSIEKSLDSFENILLQREFFKIGFYIFGFNTIELHFLLAKKELRRWPVSEFKKQSNAEDLYDTIYRYFWSQRWLPVNSTLNEDLTKSEILESLSKLEKEWLRDYFSKSPVQENWEKFKDRL